MNTTELDQLANEIEQGFMRPGGWKTCRYLLGKFADKVKQHDLVQARLEACKSALDSLLDGGATPDEEAVMLLEAAIAKAEGKEVGNV